MKKARLEVFGGKYQGQEQKAGGGAAVEMISLSVDGQNSRPGSLRTGRMLEFYGKRITTLKTPHLGRRRKGSMGTDFNLYRTCGGHFILHVEHWSLRPGGENSSKFEFFRSAGEMTGKPLQEDGHYVSIPEKIISAAWAGGPHRER